MRGAWHQCGSGNQKMISELLRDGYGSGVVLSSRDLSLIKLLEYSYDYQSYGAEILFDPQFYVPSFRNRNTDTYPLNAYRKAISDLNKLDDSDLEDFSKKLQATLSVLPITGVIAPAVIYEAGRPDILELNAKLFRCVRTFAQEKNLPIYSTIILGTSVTQSQQETMQMLSDATQLESDGCYFGFEFEQERVPVQPERVRRFCEAVLSLAGRGQPLMHAFAGPMSILSLASGATSVGIGHTQSLWQFKRDRFVPSTSGGGGGDQAARFFSEALWGTIVNPDEVAQLPSNLRLAVLTSSPYGSFIDKRNAGMHLVSVLCSMTHQILSYRSVRQRAEASIKVLESAVELHSRIRQTHFPLRDNTDAYQRTWMNTLRAMVTDHSGDYDFLDMIS